MEIAPGIFITTLSWAQQLLTTQWPLKLIKLVALNLINFLLFYFKLVKTVLAWQLLCNLFTTFLPWLRKQYNKVYMNGSIFSTFQPEHGHLTMCDNYKTTSNPQRLLQAHVKPPTFLSQLVATPLDLCVLKTLLCWVFKSTKIFVLGL